MRKSSNEITCKDFILIIILPDSLKILKSVEVFSFSQLNLPPYYPLHPSYAYCSSDKLNNPPTFGVKLLQPPHSDNAFLSWLAQCNHARENYSKYYFKSIG